MDGRTSRGSVHDQRGTGRERTTSLSSLRHQHPHLQDLRQESLPFQSTLINTAGRDRREAEMQRGPSAGGPYSYPEPQPFQANAAWNGNNGYDQFDPNNLNGQPSAYAYAGNAARSPYQHFGTAATETFGGNAAGMGMEDIAYGYDQNGWFPQDGPAERTGNEFMDDGIFRSETFQALSGSTDNVDRAGVNSGQDGNAEVNVGDIMEDLLQT
jgi:hypothetical protein